LLNLTRRITDGVKKVEGRGRTSEESQRIVSKKWKEEIAGWINYTHKKIH
jgi:hypothetical protein